MGGSRRPSRKGTTQLSSNSDSEARRSALQKAERLRHLSETERDLIRLANEPKFRRWLEQIQATGGCAHPIYLAGHTTTLDADTGAVLRHYSTLDEPGRRLALRCRNRRNSVCEPCSRIHSGDTFHLVRAGLMGGKGTPAGVASHPRLFVTLTAPGFGAVHRGSRTGVDLCRPRRSAPTCTHGRPASCGKVHAPTDSIVGQPLCAHCYDYTSHVLWHAKVGELWNRSCRTIGRRLAAAAGIPQRGLPRHLRLSFAKVAEFQKRGAIHLHAVIRIDGPEGPDSPPPSWATKSLLTTAVHSALESVEVTTPYAPRLGQYTCRWGSEIDVHPIGPHSRATVVSDEAVAAYVAKYVSKSVGDVGGVDYRITSAREIPALPVNAHIRALIGTCWRLGGIPELESLRLRLWAHSLGFRGHVLTKSRKYSTTYAALHAARTAYRARNADGHNLPATVIDSAWRYVGSGHTPAEAEIAAGIAAAAAREREIAMEES
ncbi:plasmid replication initiator protein [Streptomyces sp. LX-29]|uniref:replication initiator n=1 Tax=Streptomyces sp. LX-29 TaxID=2900152 RepID=UPI00240D17BD|nr:replication initiator [Streptomyces sp. LX-29]WFB09608.1 plasmid replication initiator protein [Streptomyces sp. LX-29]